MSPRLPVVRAKQLVDVLKVLGFLPVRQRGSHQFWKHPDGRTTLVSRHSGEDIGRGLLRQILREIGISPEEFARLLRN